MNKPNNDITTIHSKPEIGIINGLYATGSGNGGIIPIQVFNNYLSNKNDFDIKLTGSMGETMKESIQCSLTAAIEWLKHSEYKDRLDELMNNHVKNGFGTSFILENILVTLLVALLNKLGSLLVTFKFGCKILSTTSSSIVLLSIS